MRKSLPIIIVIIIIAAVIGLVLANNDNDTSTPASPPPTSTTPNQNQNTQNPSSNNTSTQPTETDKVSITNSTFSPAQITVKKGTTVTWTNNDSIPHTVTADSGTGPDSETLENGETYTFKFDTGGSFSYHCTFHSDMHGKVVVTE